MIRFRKSNPVRDLVGAIVFAVAATLLWVESSVTSHRSGGMMEDGSATREVASIRSADFTTLDRL
ncbi:MAG TPA: hypothetical protein VLA43_17060 [Longimicrobiales bacterium]|nr:hypothetical protein [Longimicrobiales bacterium]